MNQQVADTERDEIFARLRQNPDNNKCFDCDKKNPKWSSVYLAIYLCLDCAGKHREYGPQISFARSINLDSWNRRYITFMELGGNTKAAEAFRKNGLKQPYDYKCAAIQKYKQDLTKKVDAALNTGTKVEEPKPVASKPEEPKNLISNGPAPINTNNNIFGEEKKVEDEDPFANNVIIPNNNVKTKGFSVEFNKKPTFGNTNKGRLAAKKVENFDLDSLTLNEDGSEIKTSKTDLMPTSAGLKMSHNSIDSTNEVKEVYTKSSSPYLKEPEQQETFKKFQNAKAISSDSFNTQKDSIDRSKMNQFSGASSISSAQYYGEKEEPANQGIDYYQVGENVKDFVNVWGNKLKEKSEGWMTKIKSEWQQ